jgi:hypothetical protein
MNRGQKGRAHEQGTWSAVGDGGIGEWCDMGFEAHCRARQRGLG